MAPHHGPSADFSAVHSAEPRFLASGDEGSALSAWVGAAIAMVGMLLAACTIGAAAFLYQRHRNRTVLREVTKVQMKSTENGGKNLKSQAWSDPEAGGEPKQTETVLEKGLTIPPPPNHSDNPVVPDKLSPSVRLELAETLRGILEVEISRGLKASGISDRLDQLEQQAKDQQVLSGSLLPPPSTKSGTSDLAQTVKAQVGIVGVSSSAGWDSEATLKPPEVKVTKRDAETLTEPPPPEDPRSISAPPPPPHPRSAPLPPHQQNLAPSKRQLGNQDPPEKGWMHIDEDRSLRVSLMTTQRKLNQRDLQTQELHRQLRQTEQDCWNQKSTATHAVRRLQELLCDPSVAPKVQAEELRDMRNRVEDLSRGLADSKQSEVQWQIVAKRQRAFFMQSERVAQEGVNLFRKHPAGELFLAPPPVYLEDDMDEDPRKPPWDVGNSHINPYVNDSWPFEPNACAQRCSVEPNLGRWDEEDGIVETDSEDGSPGSNGTGDDADAERAQLMLRLPSLPPESPHSQDFEPPEPTEAPEPLHIAATMSARSL